MAGADLSGILRKHDAMTANARKSDMKCGAAEQCNYSALFFCYFPLEAATPHKRVFGCPDKFTTIFSDCLFRMAGLV
jgi:hypothetical protein